MAASVLTWAPRAAEADAGIEPASVCDELADGAIMGTDGADHLVGTDGDDVIIGGSDSDFIDGRGGDDVICGGHGSDVIVGGTGHDTIDGGADNDQIDGGAGDDELIGGDGNDELKGGDGSDALEGGPGNDVLRGGAGSDGLHGGSGHDKIFGGSGNDSLWGAEDNDELKGGDGDDLCLAGSSPGDTTRECETTSADPTPLSEIDQGAPADIGPRVVEVAHEPFLPDLRVVIDSAGGITARSVSIVPARWAARIVPKAMASGAWDITVPSDAPPINGAQLTIPYDDSLLPPGYDESNLRILTFDEEYQLWHLAGDNQAVDLEANTVTTAVEHFSIFAVMMVDNEGTLADFVRPSIPIVCIPEDAGTSIGLDVVLMIDQSGSMSWEDPDGLRVDAAKAFVDELRDEDRVGVVSFASSATRRSGLLTLGDDGARDGVAAAIEATRQPGGGTNISAPMLEMLDIYDDAPVVDGARIRIGILLTDGVGSYSTAITSQAAEEQVIVYTIGLGGGVDDDLLQGIADGTGGRYEKLSTPDQLVPIYEELVGGLIDDGTDTDEDRLTDCEETNGLMSALGLFEPDGTYPLFYFSDPVLVDSDGDTVPDNFQPGAEQFEVIRAPLEDNDYFVREYPYLVEAGIKSYFRVMSDPLEIDSDGDSFNDDEDPKPLDPTVPALDGVPFDVPITTLYQRVEYGDQPATAKRWVLKPLGTGLLVRSVGYRNSVLYDENHDCVERCWDLEEWAESEPNDNGNVPCFFGRGRCVTEEDQMRDAVRQIITAQAMFERDDMFASESFVGEQATAYCLIFYAECDPDEVEDVVDEVNPDGLTPDLALVAGGGIAGGTAVKTGLRANPKFVELIVATLLAEYGTDRNLSPSARNADNLDEATRRCVESPLLSLKGLMGPGRQHPCEAMNIYFPGPNLNMAYDFRADALDANRTLHVQNWLPDGLRTDGLKRKWYNSELECSDAARAQAPADYECDEFPNFRTVQAGRLSPPRALLQLLDEDDNAREGAYFGNFGGRHCGLAPREEFAVVAMPKDGPNVTLSICAKGGS